MKLLYFTLLFVFIPFTLGEDNKTLPQEQPDCRFNAHVTSFYDNHANNLKEAPADKNWICQESFDNLLKYCFTLFKIMSSRSVETQYKINESASNVEKECRNHVMEFWKPDDSSTEPSKKTKVTLEARMFHCPINGMELQFPKAENPPELRDFYITEGRNNGTIAVLRNSTTGANVCLTNMYRPKGDFKKPIF